MNNSAPYMYEQLNIYNSAFNPSGIHSRNTALTRYYQRYLFKKVTGLFEFDIPENWPINYFKACIFGLGYVAIINTDRWGIIPQNCSLSGFDVYYQPKRVVFANPLIKNSGSPVELWKAAGLIKLQPDYSSVMDIVSTYADLLSLCMETAGTNLINSKLSYIFASGSKTAAESFKKLYDQVAGGEPASFIDKELLTEDGAPNWFTFAQNLGQNYITDRILNDMKTIEAQFDTLVGIPNANTQKRERLITDEVNANNIDTDILSDLWLETMQRDIERVNDLFDLNISVQKKYTEGSAIYNER
jgi:hypothetical protein